MSVHRPFLIVLFTLEIAKVVKLDYAFCSSELCDFDETSIQVYQRNSSEKLTLLCNESLSQEDDDTKCLPDDIHSFMAIFSEKHPCVLDLRHQLKCSWNRARVPNMAEFSATVLSCAEAEEEVISLNLNCALNKLDNNYECYSHSFSSACEETVILEANLSLQNLLYITTKYYDKKTIEKLDPPPNITASINSNILIMKWDLPHSLTSTQNPTCFVYQLKINDQPKPTELRLGDLAYNKTVNPTETHKIQMRVKRHERCGSSEIWSDWSNVLEVQPPVKPNVLNPGVIAVIVFVLPMILLAFLLLYKLQRVSEKIFPPIPSPSAKIKVLIEEDNHFQTVTYKYVEEITEVVDAGDLKE